MAASISAVHRLPPSRKEVSDPLADEVRQTHTRHSLESTIRNLALVFGADNCVQLFNCRSFRPGSVRH